MFPRESKKKTKPVVFEIVIEGYTYLNKKGELTNKKKIINKKITVEHYGD